MHSFSTSIYLISIFNSRAIAAGGQEVMKNLLIDLPEDFFINNILLSKVLPNKYLLSLKCVCKYLRNIITSTAFINMHLHHSTTSPPGHHELNNQLVLIDSDTPYDVFYSLKFNDGDDPCRPEVIMFDYPIKSPQIWGSCNGLLCLSSNTDDDRVCLWNPLTKEYKYLPPPLPSTKILPMGITKVSNRKCGSITYGFGYDRFIDDYKIIRCQHFFGHLDGDEENYGDHISITEFQVYTLGTNTWRKISSTTADNNSYYVLPFMLEHTFLNGALHWVMSTSKMTEAKIVSFDIEKEVFREMQMPLISENDYCFFRENIQVVRGCLCALEFDWNEKCCNIWMMMDYGVKESWTKLFTIVQNEIKALNDKIEFSMLEGDAYDVDEFIMPQPEPYYRLLRFCENGEILIGSDNILFIYDPTNNKARRVEFGEIGMYFFQTEIFIESLVSLNSGVYIESEVIRASGCIDLD